MASVCRSSSPTVRRVRTALGSLVGAVGGLTFVLGNAGGLPDGWPWPVRALGLLAFLAVLWFAVVRVWDVRDPTPPAPRAVRTYGLSVVGMLLLFPIGNLLLRAGGRPELTLPWVVLVVGAHFLPMARAFRVPVLRAVGLALMAVAVLGAVLVLTLGPGWPVSATAVAAGSALLAAASVGPRRRAAD